MSRISKLKYEGEVGACCGNFCDKSIMIAELKREGVKEFVKMLYANTIVGSTTAEVIRIMSEEYKPSIT